MKRNAPCHKAKRSLKQPIAFLLCLLLTIAFYAPPALADSPGGDETPVSVSETAKAPQPETAQGQEDSFPEIQEAPSPLLEEGEQSPEGAQEEEPGNTDAPDDPVDTESPEEPVIKKYTVTFKLGVFGTEIRQTEPGAYPQDVPSIPQLPAATVLGWFDEQGTQVDPAFIPVQKDTVYTAQWSRNVKDFLSTQEHFSYINGYQNGMFKPQAGITRAEAAQLFYNLLSSKSWEKKTFSDVSEDSWYAAPVGVMAALGVLQGYTDGRFQPNRKITRAEFVKMAVSCDTLENGEVSFKDVPAASWAAPYIATATKKGWVSGYKDGTFQPGYTITRAEAVAILNKLLGRKPEADVKHKPSVKNFYDVFPSSWAYGDIVEASTSHSFSTSGTGEEVWGDYEKDTRVLSKSMWYKEDGKVYYLDAPSRKFLRGMQTINGKKYLFDSSTGEAVTGFRMEGSWRRYYLKGSLQKDISGLKVVSGPYYIKVYKPSNYLIIFAQDEKGNFNTPVRAMRTSCGYGTPCGTFYTPDRYRWLKMIGDTFAQWCTQIEGNYLFHSVPNWTQNNFDLEVEEYNHLGETRSMGCIRLNCRDAKWIYDNCALGTKVFISAVEKSGPLEKPAGIQIPSWHTWDPTDPTAAWKCKQNGCH